MIKFRLADNLALDYSDFRDEGLRVAVFARVVAVSRIWRLCLRSRLWKELKVTKIVKEVPMEIKAVVDSPPITSIPPPTATTMGARDDIPEAVLTCKHPEAVKVYLYLTNNPGNHTLAEISSMTALDHESQPSGERPPA
jgi:hypothetical protein